MSPTDDNNDGIRRISRQQLRAEYDLSEQTMGAGEEVARQALSGGAHYAVFAFGEAPQALRDLLCLNSGDEDWIVLTRRAGEWAPWIDRTDANQEPLCYVLDGLIAYVGSHG